MKAGLDLGGTKIQAVVTGDDGDVLGSARRDTPASGGPGAVTRELSKALRDALADAGATAMGLSGVGVGVPGGVDAASGTVFRVDVDGWGGRFPLARALGEQLGRPVVVGNDASVAVEAKLLYGAGPDVGSFLGVFWGTGVGGGIVLDRRLWQGR